MSKLGIHVSSGDRHGFGDLLSNCAKAKSPIAVIFEVDQDVSPDRNTYSPNTILIYRTQHDAQGHSIGDGPGDMYVGQPIESARSWMNLIMPVWAKNPADYYAPINEQQAGNLAGWTWLNAFTLECLNIAEANGYKLALYAFSSGQPKDPTDKDDLDQSTAEQKWHELLTSLQKAKAGGHILLLHEYGLKYGSLQASAPNGLALRYRRDYAYLSQFDADPDLVISECGPGAGGIWPDVASWVRDLAWYDSELMKDPKVKGACVYQAGGAENIKDGFGVLGAYIAATPTPVVDPAPSPIPAPAPAPLPTPQPVSHPRVVTCYLAPQDATLDELKTIQGDAFPTRSTVCQSADDAHDLMSLGLPGSKVIVYDPERWTGGDIIAYLQVATEVRSLSNVLLAPYLSQLSSTAAYAPGDCGPAVLAMLLNYVNQTTLTVDQVSKETGKPSGFLFTGFDDLAAVAVGHDSKLDHLVNASLKDITNEIDAGHPVIALVNYAALPAAAKREPNYKDAHFLLIVGYTEADIVYHDPDWYTATDGAFKRMARTDFDHAWATTNQDFSTPRQMARYSHQPKPAANFPPAWVGLHMRADGSSTATDFKIAKTAKIEAAKILSSAPPQDFDQLVALGIKPDHIVLRLFADFNGRIVTPQDFYSWQSGAHGPLTWFAQRGGVYVEVHNEPNLPQEGLGKSWADATGFAAWFGMVAAMIKHDYPTLKVGFPGLSPQSNVADWLTSCAGVMKSADWIGAHCYWTSEAQMLDLENGQYYQRFLQFGKPVMITEFSNLDGKTQPATKGDQYVRYYQSLGGQVLAAFAFVSTASDPLFATETWADEHGNFSTIASVVSDRLGQSA